MIRRLSNKLAMGIVMHLTVIGAANLVLTPTASAGPQEEYAKLEEEMESAMDAFLQAMDAQEKQRKEPSDGPAPPAAQTKAPSDGRLEVLKKMDDLVAASAGKPEVGVIALGTFQWAAMVEPAKAFSRFEKLVAKFADEPALPELLTLVPEFYKESGTAEVWLRSLEQLRKATKRDENRFAAAMTTGRIQLQEQKVADAKQSFELAKSSPDPELAKAAKGYLFEIERLQVGMAAPDFTAKTLDGRDVSLLSLRGKAVLLNFWASW